MNGAYELFLKQIFLVIAWLVYYFIRIVKSKTNGSVWKWHSLDDQSALDDDTDILKACYKCNCTPFLAFIIIFFTYYI